MQAADSLCVPRSTGCVQQSEESDCFKSTCTEQGNNVCAEGQIRHNKEKSQSGSAENNLTGNNISVDDSDNWCEVDDRPVGIMDTMLQEPDITEFADGIISFVLDEGNRPVGIFTDKDSEYLSFPTIYCGKRRHDNKERVVPVHYSTICKWELRCQDRRVAQCVPNIFYKLKKLQIRQIQGSASLGLRKCKTKRRRYRAVDFKSPENVHNIVHQDDGFRVLKNLRGLPPYFERCKKDLFAMIRQLGNPTRFCSFSAAETRWVHLLEILGRLLDKKDYSDNDIKNMNWQKKCELIQNDPVTCARNFEHMVQLFFHHFMNSSLKPIGPIIDFFYRVEFQQRSSGSPHIHSLMWIEGAPLYQKNSDDDVIKFIDKYVTCSSCRAEISGLISLQTHKHAKSCKKRGQEICRFNFPFPPMPRTVILQPLDLTGFDSSQLEQIKDNYKKTKKITE